MQTILALETSCDETAAAVIRGGRTIISSEVASQMHLHERYGGVVPEVASREHILSMTPVIEAALAPLSGGWDEIDAVACTYGPGLAGALLTGINAAKGLAWARGLPLIGVNHLEAHIYANWLVPVGTAPDDHIEPIFPLVSLVVSGGHTTLVLLRDHGDYQFLGQTRDDAAGEAFDKAARIMGLGYPGGPQVERTAAGVDRAGVRVPRAWLGDSYDFSFSGVKTHVLNAVAEHQAMPETDDSFIPKLAGAFQDAVVDVLVSKTVRAAQTHGARCILLAGGVAANRALRDTLIDRSPIPVHSPPIRLCTDNAAMVGAAAYFRSSTGLQHNWSLSARPNLKLVTGQQTT